MAHIAIITGAHLCRNPRVVKEAEALSAAGYRVTVLRPVLSGQLAALDAEIATGASWEVQTTVDLTAGPARSRWTRLVRRAGAEAVQRGLDLPEALGYGVRQTLRLARAVDADLTIGHQEVGTWVCACLARAGRRIGVDIEDWYSRLPSPSQRDRVPIELLDAMEGETLRGAAFATTTSHSLAAALAATYGAPKPQVVYNAFPWSDREAIDGQALDRPDRSRLSLHWVSQTIGPDRGLDLLFDALRHVPTPVEVHLRGVLNREHEGWLRETFPSGSHGLHVHALVPPHKLLSRIAEHDVGIAFETDDIVNRDLTVTNKILHYLLGGLAVVATRTAGQEEIAARAPDAITLVNQNDARAMGAAINALASDTDGLRRARAAALDAARQTYCWERQAPVVVSTAANALRPRS